MVPEQLGELRDFFASYEPRLPDAVALMYSRLLEAVPEARQLFKGDFQEQQRRYLHMLQELVKLTRSRQLWPIQASTGTSTIPLVDKLASVHGTIGVTRAHFDKMKEVLAQCFREDSPREFTPAAEEGLSFIFDVVAKASANASGVTEEKLARKNKLPHSDEIEAFSPGSGGREQHFWEWFAGEEDLLFNFERNRDRASGLLAAALGNVSPGLTFEFGPVSKGVRNFVISAGGFDAAFPAVEALAAAAPALPRWNVIKFRPRRDPIIPRSFGGKTVDPGDVQFSILSDGQELGLYLYFDGYCEEERAVWDQIGYLLLDEALGEFDAGTKVGLIEFFPSDVQHEGKRFPFLRLPEIFDEEYASLRQTH